MDIVSNRRRRLQEWIDTRYDGKQVSFVDATNINQGELSGLLNKKSFGEKRARRLEHQAGMPEMYLDKIEDGLPQELIDELSGGGIDKQELLIVELIEAAGGMLSLDRILIGIYKSTGEVIKRHLITAKLYRMSQNGMIFRVPKKKGLYTTKSSLGDLASEEDQ